MLKLVVDRLDAAESLDGVLDALRQAFHLGRLVLRDAEERVLAAAPSGSPPPGIPAVRLTSETLFPSGDTTLRLGVRGFRLPERGGRLQLRADQGFVSLDLWEGDERGLTLDEWRTLEIAASIVGLALDGGGSRARSVA